MTEKQLYEIEKIAKEIPGHLIIQNALWFDEIMVPINYNLDGTLDYLQAFRNMKELINRQPERD